MTADQAPLPGPAPGRADKPTSTGPGIVSSGWLAANSEYGHDDGRNKRRASAMATSLLVHGGLVVALIVAFTVVPQQIAPTENLIFLENIVYPPEPGKGGGGGGNPAPAPPKKTEVPEHAPPPAVVPEITVKPVEPPPVSLIAPIQTNTTALLQSTGNSSVSLAALGGGGSGGGMGSGRGAGVGPGTEAGFGGGAFAPGNGVSWPDLIEMVKPIYTPEAMRTKMQGIVTLEVVVLENGRVGDVRVVKSLDRASGLDAAAITAAKQWTFKPGMKDGKPVATKVTLELEFRLH
jgi:TonB family protein